MDVSLFIFCPLDPGIWSIMYMSYIHFLPIFKLDDIKVCTAKPSILMALSGKLSFSATI